MLVLHPNFTQITIHQSSSKPTKLYNDPTLRHAINRIAFNAWHSTKISVFHISCARILVNSEAPYLLKYYLDNGRVPTYKHIRSRTCMVLAGAKYDVLAGLTVSKSLRNPFTNKKTGHGPNWKTRKMAHTKQHSKMSLAIVPKKRMTIFNLLVC